MGLGKATLRCDQGATFRMHGRWRGPLLDPVSGDPILDAEGNVQAGPPISLTGYTGRMHVRKTISAAEFDLELTTENDGVVIPQPNPSIVLGWCRLATPADHDLQGLNPVDGITPVEGDRILVKSQSNPPANGVYVASAGIWPRAPEADQAADLAQGATVWVREGVRYDDTTWRQVDPLTSFSEAQTWEQEEDVGVFLLYATDEQTATLVQSGVYDVELVSGGGEVTRVLEGKFRLSKEVTRT
jgi:hypothetical protein